MEEMKIEELIKSGAHFGHPVSKWNPKFKPLIADRKNGIYIIDLYATLKHLNEATSKLIEIVGKGGNILFIGTKSQAKDIVQTHADKCGMFYIVERWLGGTLTNFSTIKKSIRRLVMLEKESSHIYKDKTKKERNILIREKLKLSDLHRGIKDMKHLPAAVFVVDANHEKIAVSEAKCLGIPTFGLVDTNTNPYCLDYPIPANDDSIKTINLIISYIADSIINIVEGKNKSLIDSDQEKLQSNDKKLDVDGSHSSNVNNDISDAKENQVATNSEKDTKDLNSKE